MSDLEVILFFGMHGSGKTTVGERLAQEIPGYVHWSSGETIRSVDVANLSSDLAKEIVHYRFTEEYLPDKYMLQLLQEDLNDSSLTYILDGIPANTNQLLFIQNNFLIRKNFFFDVDEDVAVERLLKRASRKTDSTREAINNRNKPYFEETLPALTSIPHTRINANLSEREVYEQVIASLYSSSVNLLSSK
ncbi:MAG: nucleoside monophosphate kinase [Candidatus Woesearchaeota archaeon]